MSERQVNEKQKEVKEVNTLAGAVFTNSGNPIAPVYKRVYDKDLDANIVKKVDETNLQEFIQASRATTDLAILQKRFIELGEIPAVDPTLGSNDLTQFPSDIHGVYKMVNDVAGNFAKLPESIQKIFGTKEAYLESLMNGTYQATLINAINAENKAAEEVKQESEEK